MTYAAIIALGPQVEPRLLYADDLQQFYMIPKGAAGDAAVAMSPAAAHPPMSASNAAERKGGGGYWDSVTPLAGMTRVVQLDLPNVIWLYLGGDPALDAAWLAMPTSADGVFDFGGGGGGSAAAVVYDQAQALTPAQQLRARQNTEAWKGAIYPADVRRGYYVDGVLQNTSSLSPYYYPSPIAAGIIEVLGDYYAHSVYVNGYGGNGAHGYEGAVIIDTCPSLYWFHFAGHLQASTYSKLLIKDCPTLSIVNLDSWTSEASQGFGYNEPSWRQGQIILAGDLGGLTNFEANSYGLGSINVERLTNIGPSANINLTGNQCSGAEIEDLILRLDELGWAGHLSSPYAPELNLARVGTAIDNIVGRGGSFDVHTA